MSNALKQTQFPPLNKVEQWAALSAGNPQVAAYRGALLEVQDQLAKILQGGSGGSGTSDKKLEQGAKVLDQSFNPRQMAETAETMRTLLANRKQEIIGDNRYLQRWHGVPNTSAMVTVQIPGSPSGQIPAASLDQFKRDHPNAVVSQ